MREVKIAFDGVYQENNEGKWVILKILWKIGVFPLCKNFKFISIFEVILKVLKQPWSTLSIHKVLEFQEKI